MAHLQDDGPFLPNELRLWFPLAPPEVIRAELDRQERRQQQHNARFQFLSAEEYRAWSITENLQEIEWMKQIRPRPGFVQGLKYKPRRLTAEIPLTTMQNPEIPSANAGFGQASVRNLWGPTGPSVGSSIWADVPDFLSNTTWNLPGTTRPSPPRIESGTCRPVGFERAMRRQMASQGAIN